MVGVACELSPVQTGTLPLQYTVGLHAWFLDCCGPTNPELSQYLHDGQSEKLSTLSQFEGQMELQGRELKLSDRHTYRWYITG